MKQWKADFAKRKVSKECNMNNNDFMTCEGKFNYWNVHKSSSIPNFKLPKINIIICNNIVVALFYLDYKYGKEH